MKVSHGRIRSAAPHTTKRRRMLISRINVLGGFRVRLIDFRRKNKASPVGGVEIWDGVWYNWGVSIQEI